MQAKHNSWRVWVALAVVSVSFGANYLAIRIAAASIPPLLFQGIRFTLAGAILYLWAVANGYLKNAHPTPRQWFSALLIGGVMLFIGQGGVAWSEQFVQSGMAALIVATIPLFVVMLSRLFLKSPLSLQTAAGLLLGFLGLIPIVHFNGAGAVNPLPVAVLLAAALAWAIGSVYAKRAELHAHFLVSMAMQMICGGIALLATSFISGELSHVTAVALSAPVIEAVTFLTLVGGVVAYSAFGWLLQRAPPAITAMFAYISPMVAVAAGWLVLGEQITLGTVVGGCIILSGVALVMSAGSRTTHLSDVAS